MIGRRPSTSEYDPRFERYMQLVPEADICAALTQQLRITADIVNHVPASLVDYRYAPGKWTTREVIGHVLDTERIFGFRLLTFARGDQAPLMRAEEELYVTNGKFSRFPLEQWMEELSLSREANIALIRHLPEEAWDRNGTVSGLPISVRAIAYLMAGHERHHIRILQNQYLKES
jgi:hypothetical protein